MQKRKSARADSRILGLYPDFPSLRAGVANLKALQLRNEDISVLFPEAVVSKSLSLCEPDSFDSHPQAFIGGTLAWLTYLRPERVGIISAALVELGVAEHEAQLYELCLRQGRLLVCVRSTAQNDLTSTIRALTLAGAERVIAVRISSRHRGTVLGRHAPLDGTLSTATLVS